MLQKIFTYIAYTFSLAIMLYLLFVIWWIFLPVFIVLFAIGAWRMYQTRKMWDSLLKQAQNGKKVHKHYRKIEDDNVIDVDYEEIKS